MGTLDSGFQESTFIFLMVIGILIMLAFALSFVIYANFTQKKLMAEQMRNQKQAYQLQEALLHSTIMTQEAERKRIARELHDEIGSKLNIIFLNIHRLKAFSEEQVEMKKITTEINALIHTTINTTRRISHDLLPPTLEEFGLAEAIKELQYSLHQTERIRLDFELMENELRTENTSINLNLFRIVQELIRNSIQHGKATNIVLQLWIKTNVIRMKYQDNGVGFNKNDIEYKKGLGMKNIESRLHMMHAHYQYDTALEKGFTMTLELK